MSTLFLQTGGRMKTSYITMFTFHHDKPELLEEKTHTGVCACVWDLKVISFKRDAWLEKVLKNENEPDIWGYLNCRLHENL